MNKKEITSRYVSLVTYLKEEDILKVIGNHTTAIRSYCYIYHYKDKAEKHYHLLLRLYNAHSLNSVIYWFKGFKDECNEDINTFGEIIRDRSAMRLYLTHENQPDKEKYELNEVEGDIIDVCGEEGENKPNIAYEIIKDLIDGMPYIDMVKQYGTEFVRYYKNYREVAGLIKLQNIKDFKKSIDN